MSKSLTYQMDSSYRCLKTNEFKYNITHKLHSEVTYRVITGVNSASDDYRDTHTHRYMS